MKKGMKTMGALVLAVALTATACSGEQQNTQGENNARNDAKQPETVSPKEAPSFKLYVSDVNKPVPSGNLLEDPTIKYMAEKTGINPQITFFSHANYVDQLKLKFASDDFPDVYLGYGLSQGDGALENGLIMPLNDLIEQHGPNMKRVIPQSVWDSVTVNGEIMAIPQPNHTPSSRVLYVRKDWMEQVGVTAIPTTSDELLDMLRKFKDGDPNQNGEKDEIPFTMRENFSWTGDNIWGMWGISPYEGIELNGEIVPGFLHPNFKKGLEFMQIMYREGLLDAEFLVNSTPIWSQKINAGLAGVWGHVPSDGYKWQESLTDSLPDAGVDVITIPTPRGTGYDGPIGATVFPVDKSYLIMKTAKDPASIIKFFDWLYTEEGQLFTELGVKGINYAEESGTYFYKAESEVEQKTEWRQQFKMHGYNEQAFAAKYTGLMKEKMQAAIEISNAEGIPSLTMGMPAVGQNLFNLYYEYHEPAAKIIIDGAPVDETWDQFAESWRAMGGQELIDEMTNWYNNNKK
ncbi:hypothetical protein B1748_01225 [Paenibacillus sp. MY03]|jgi:putative aldouronate transport system substrate-binding protein|uniref:extracellular solute-binding protein n=1 Tax=Paenibacillus sp. MY03 TaxID=302980 RepID=UPI000B3C92EF|nr:extracellular solute-binding protein [Paenibacillus sp. MY03]OUS78725.1 hypothetical protein B1748_01225 [Paenibacillus sp. MY03]